jgi:putative DNA primase/helicase
VEALTTDHRWSGVLAYNRFTGAVELRKQPPCRAVLIPSKWEREWSESDSARTADWLGDTWGFHPAIEVVGKAAHIAAQVHAFHPVCEYLDGIQWDGKRRADRMLIDYCGARDDEYSVMVGRSLLVSAVARVRQPGCKVDTMVILEGRQGSGKSSAVSLLGGQWFRDTDFDIGTKDSYQVIRNCWVYEMQELAQFSSTREARKLKSFISGSSDNYRPSYGHRVMQFPRQCIFIGTTNESAYLSDPTGNRRYFPVITGAIDLTGLERDRDQLWAEADMLYHDGVAWHPQGVAMRQLAEAEQDARQIEDSWETKIANYVSGSYRAAQYAIGEGVTLFDILGDGCLQIPSAQQTRGAQMRAAAILRKLGMVRVRKPRCGPKEPRGWHYLPAGHAAQTDLGLADLMDPYEARDMPS